MQTRGPSAAFALLVLALWLRLLVPTGWMPAEQGLGLRPCTPAPVVEALHRADHHDHHRPAKPEQKQDAHRACPFTALAMALGAPPQPPLLADLPVAPDLPARWPRKGSPTLALVAPPPPSTGPPHLI